MKSVFDTQSRGGGRFKDAKSVRDAVLTALDKKEWVSTAEMYAACQQHVRRDVLHDVLKQLLADREIRMRVMPRLESVKIGSGKTEFKRTSPPNEPK